MQDWIPEKSDVSGDENPCFNLFCVNEVMRGWFLVLGF